MRQLFCDVCRKKVKLLYHIPKIYEFKDISEVCIKCNKLILDEEAKLYNDNIIKIKKFIQQLKEKYNA